MVKRVNVGMMMRHPELGCSLSDHFAVEATLVFQPFAADDDDRQHENPQPPGPAACDPTPSSTLHPGSSAVAAVPQTDEPPAASRPDSALHNGTYLQSPTPSSIRDPPDDDDDPRSPASQLRSFLLHPPPQSLTPDSNNNNNSAPTAAPGPSPADLDAILAQIRAYARRERAQRRRRLAHFVVSLAAVAACLAGVWLVAASRRGGGGGWAAFVLALAACAALAAGLLDGLLALLFFGAELGALREFAWEVRNAKRRMAAAAAAGTASGGGMRRVVGVEEEEEEEERGGGGKKVWDGGGEEDGEGEDVWDW